MTEEKSTALAKIQTSTIVSGKEVKIAGWQEREAAAKVGGTLIPWTRFMDMHSGGGRKLDWSHIYIQAPEGKARAIFEMLFHRDPDHTTCNCCGRDYSVDESPTLGEASAYDRNCHGTDIEGEYVHLEMKDPRYRSTEWRSLEEYVQSPDVKVINAQEVDEKALEIWRRKHPQPELED